MNDEKKKVVLTRGKHYTLTTLANFLNETYGNKPSGTSYTAVDIQKYVVRGHLPEYLGGNVLTEFQDTSMGLKMIIVDKPSKSKRRGNR